MRVVHGVVLSLLVLGLSAFVGEGSAARAQDDLSGASACDADAAKLVGTWEGADDKTKMVSIEFTKDNKMKFAIAGTVVAEGTYSVAKDTLTMKVKVGDKEQAQDVTIAKLTDTELELKKGDDVQKFKKKK